jgi:hypothetical protein
MPPAEARDRAIRLVDHLRDLDVSGSWRAPLDLDGIDLAPALEQQIFFALRDGRGAPVGAAAALRARILGLGQLWAAAAAAMLPRPRLDPGAGPVVALVREKIHVRTLVAIEEELRALSGQPIAIVRVGRAAGGSVDHALAPPLWRLTTRRMLRAVMVHRRQLDAVRRAGPGRGALLGSGERGRELAEIAHAELARIALAAAALASVASAWRPSILVAFDEVGTWARILPAVARRHGIPSLDLPHAEAADADAITGAGYDRMAVYGPRAAAVLRRAGISSERIAEIGAPRFDGLRELAATAVVMHEPRRVVFAGQYPAATLTVEMLAAGLHAALAAAERVRPSEVVAVPHPAEPRGLLGRLASEARPPAGVQLRVAEGDLQDWLPGAWLMVTCWSNGVLEAAMLGVPAMTVHAPGAAPVDFAADGLATAASGPDAAARIAGGLLDPQVRERLSARAAAALRERLGPELGHASLRAARLIADLQR